MNAPRVSVIIPAYNSGPLVEEAIGSALAQTRPPAEVVVIDDGSTDDTAERLARFGPPVRVIRQANGGVSAARNRGLAAATGAFVAFLDADDVWHPDKLRRQLEAFAKRPELGLLGTLTVPWPGTFPAEPEVRRESDLLWRQASRPAGDTPRPGGLGPRRWRPAAALAPASGSAGPPARTGHPTPARCLERWVGVAEADAGVAIRPGGPGVRRSRPSVFARRCP